MHSWQPKFVPNYEGRFPNASHTQREEKIIKNRKLNMPILKSSFPSYNRTPKHHGYLNTLHPNPRNEFRTCWGRVEELSVAEEMWNDHKKPFFFPFSSAATCTNHPLEVDQRARRLSKGSNLAPMTASHRYTVNHGV
ncbi:hypothetical protein Taro_047783 [Colocasia esculenta]|uniref:Uncharacterized protein n=1 Tax=Colocasia esculenta TaxID=4460 RepID=A0A843WWD0_COLES|nr:hypothetical protein [Colocasia esculenta]